MRRRFHVGPVSTGARCALVSTSAPATLVSTGARSALVNPPTHVSYKDGLAKILGASGASDFRSRFTPKWAPVETILVLWHCELVPAAANTRADWYCRVAQSYTLRSSLYDTVTKMVSTGARFPMVSTSDLAKRFPRVPVSTSDLVCWFPRVPDSAPVETETADGHPWKPGATFPRLTFPPELWNPFPRAPLL